MSEDQLVARLKQAVAQWAGVMARRAQAGAVVNAAEEREALDDLFEAAKALKDHRTVKEWMPWRGGA